MTDLTISNNTNINSNTNDTIDMDIFADLSPKNLISISLKWELDVRCLQLSAVVKATPAKAVCIQNVKNQY